MYACQIDFNQPVAMSYIKPTVFKLSLLTIVMPPSSSSALATLIASLLYIAIFTFPYVTQYGLPFPPYRNSTHWASSFNVSTSGTHTRTSIGHWQLPRSRCMRYPHLLQIDCRASTSL